MIEEVLQPRRLHVALVILLPVVVQALIVAIFGENMLLWDEFHYVPVMEAIGDGDRPLRWLWEQHNEHRIVWTKLVMIAHASFSGWNPIVEMYVSALLVGVVALGIWKLYRAAGGESAAWFLPASLLLCSLGSYMNMLYGLMTCHYFTLIGMIWALVFLMRRTWGGLAAAAGSAVFALFSTMNAIVIWPAGLVVLVMTRQKWPRWVAWLAAMAISAAVYFRGWNAPGGRLAVTWTIDTVARAMRATLMCIGSPLSAATISWGRALGLATVAVIALAWLGIVSLRRYETHAGLVALTLVSLGCSAAVGFGRFMLGHGAILEPKYVLYSSLALIGTYLSLVCLRGYRLRDPILIGFVAVMGVGWLAANLYGYHSAKLWRQQRLQAKYLLQNAEIQTDESLAGIFHPSLVRGVAAYLNAAKLGPSRDRIDALVTPRWKDGVPTGPLLPGASIETRLLCPVDTLRDFAVAFTPSPAGVAAGTLHISVKAGGTVVARSATEAKTIDTFTYVRANPDEPFRGCRGKELLVQVWSTDNPAGPGLHAWTFPVYYSGVTRQEGAMVDNRSLAIAFNGVSNELVP